jgi:selenide,water dikinase
LRPLETIFKAQDYPDLLVGINSPDDAAVWKIDETRSIVVTTDFFTPVVDEPYDYGAIAAANSLSDIYAMGADPFMALNIAAFPPQLPTDFLSQIISGAAEKAKEAGVVIAGGHTIQDNEPKFGLVVIGMAETQQLLTKSGVQPDDILILTKPLGMGVTTTANKAEKANLEDVEEAKFWMRKLNKIPSKISTQLKLKAATDVTGFSLLGHAHEMANASNVSFVLDSQHIPFIKGARSYGEKWFFAGGAADNCLYFENFIEFSKDIDEVTKMLLFDPQTSGGLLIACPPEKLLEFEYAAKNQNMLYWKIGRAVLGKGIIVK